MRSRFDLFARIKQTHQEEEEEEEEAITVGQPTVLCCF